MNLELIDAGVDWCWMDRASQKYPENNEAFTDHSPQRKVERMSGMEIPPCGGMLTTP